MLNLNISLNFKNSFRHLLIYNTRTLFLSKFKRAFILKSNLVHIRNAGDWTSKLMEQMKSADNLTPSIKHISIDGPYGML